MKDKDPLNPRVVSLSLAFVFGIVYLVCALLFVLFPIGMMFATSTMFHGFDMMAIARTNTIGFGNVLFGLIEIIILGLLIGWLFAVIYNILLKKAR